MTNRLINEKSPYLLQHANNPVNWYPWCNEAFELAKKENKPIFLSIGYSTCHWCHVMEHESFEDQTVANLMNEVFISIKVDREERPDIDNIYMTVCQLMNGNGGWPLTIFMTPDKEPFFSGTYFQKESNHGRVGMLDIIPRIKKVWEEQHGNVLKSAQNIVTALNKISVITLGSEPLLSENILEAAYKQFLDYFDEANGGFGSENSPKFPAPHNLLFLLRHYKRTKDSKALYMVEKTLSAMRAGGIYDHIGYGFHRYSTDSKWLVPHFEKMLYDQALHVMAFSEAYQVTGKEEYKKTTQEILSYVLRDLRSPEGGFYSSEDADSEGEEGKFYVWTQKEISSLLGKEADELIQIFNVKEGEKKILYLDKYELESAQKIEESIRKLFEHRGKRIHPHKDDKILVSWNGLMIAALSKAAWIFNEPKYIQAAKDSVDFILKYLQCDGKLLHVYRNGAANISAYIEDYAFFIWSLIELYEATFEIKYLQKAIDFNNNQLKYFWDTKDGGFYFTASDSEKLLVRQKEAYDGAIPSGNAVSMLNMLRLSKISGDLSLEEKASQILNIFSHSMKSSPVSHAGLLIALDFSTGPVFEVVIVGDLNDKHTSDLLNALRLKYLPNKVVEMQPIDGNQKATVYVCKDYTCNAPTNDPAKMLELLGF